MIKRYVDIGVPSFIYIHLASSFHIALGLIYIFIFNFSIILSAVIEIERYDVKSSPTLSKNIP